MLCIWTSLKFVVWYGVKGTAYLSPANALNLLNSIFSSFGKVLHSLEY